nr:hypothetical protein B0A51_11091 [Rachicladosporium sp. CCFEE 5018]
MLSSQGGGQVHRGINRLLRRSEGAKTSKRKSTKKEERLYRLPSMSLDTADFDTMNGMIGEKRRVSAARVMNGTTARQDSGGVENVKHDEPSRNGALSPTAENGQWSSAVGHATTAGKSGRVIETLMAANDRLKKELELVLLRSQEQERTIQTMRPQLEALRTENDNLQHAKNMDSSLLKRRDRKLELMKEEMGAERTRREAAEGRARRLEAERDEAVETARAEVQRAHDEAKHSTIHASILEQSHRQLSTEYQQRAGRFRKDFAQLRKDADGDAPKVARLAVISGQMCAVFEQNCTAHEQYVEMHEKHKAAVEEWKEGVEVAASEETEKTRKLSQDMETVTKQMKWVMGMEKSREGG